MKASRIARAILITIASLMFLLAAYSKFSSTQIEIEMLKKINLLPFKNALGAIDIIITVGLWSKRTRGIIILIASAYLGGAIASELSLGGSGVIPTLVLISLWVINKIDQRTRCACGVCNACVTRAVVTK